MKEECVDEGPCGVSGRWVDDHPLGFIDGEEVLIFIQNVQGDFLCF